MQDAFEQAYGPAGDWARLFQQDDAYIRTDLILDLKAERTYMTLDFWTSKKAYDDFRQKYQAEYKAIDERCEAMTKGERQIGSFSRVGGD